MILTFLDFYMSANVGGTVNFSCWTKLYYSFLLNEASVLPSPAVFQSQINTPRSTLIIN